MARIDHATAGATCFYEWKEAGMQVKDNNDLLFIFNFKIMITKNDIRKLNNEESLIYKNYQLRHEVKEGSLASHGQFCNTKS